ncbi:MAG: efflux RND transporter periplasmic adaptor subunit [Planctomycetota bacterium]
MSLVILMRVCNRSLLALMLIAALLAVGQALAQMPATKVVVAEAQMLEAPATITLVGTADAVRRSRIGSEIAGIVAEMPARQGDLVHTGDPLCKLRDDVLSLRLAEAKASLNALKTRHEELRAGTRKEELTRLKAVLDERTAEYERWTFEIERIERLYRDSDANSKEYQDTRASFLTAERRRIAARASYDLGVEGPRKEVVRRAEYEVAEQQAVVDRIASDLSKTVIGAPFTGYIAERVAEVGEWIPAGGTVVELIDLSSVFVRIDVPESVLPYLEEGDSARVKIDALKRSFVGRVRHIIRQADERARTFPVEIEIDNRERLLASGMFARATVPAGPKGRVTAVPKDAIVERDGIPSVATVMPGEHGGIVGMLLSVSVGADVGDWIAITSGNVPAGTKVITRGNENILPFPTPVVVVDEQGTPVATGGPKPAAEVGDATAGRMEAAPTPDREEDR